MTNNTIKAFAEGIKDAIHHQIGGKVFEVVQDFITLKTFKLKPCSPLLEKYLKTTIRVSGKTGNINVYIADDSSSCLIINDITAPSISVNTTVNALAHAGYLKYVEYTILVASIDDELSQYKKNLANMNSSMLGRPLKKLAAK